jgi:PAS domain S-box-containing protein
MPSEARSALRAVGGRELPTDDPRPASILIVEDERIIARDLQQLLCDMGYDAYATAASAEEALTHASARVPDVVLMDIRIKGESDGIQAATLLRKHYPVIVIFLTAHADDTMIERAKRTEPHGYLLKPVKQAELRSMIEVGLYKRELDLSRARLRSSEQRLHTITDHVPLSIGYFDPDGRVRFANRVFRELVGHGEEAIGVSSLAFLGDLYPESYRARQRALAGETVTFVARLERHGSPRQHEVTYLPDRDASGAIVGVYALGYEVTEREQLSSDLQQARGDLESILNNIPASITSWRVDGSNRFANTEAQSRFGLQAHQALGMHVRDLLGEDRYGTAKPAIDAALEGRRQSQDTSVRQPDGQVRHYHEDYVPELRDGRVVGYHALSVDITELRRSHEQILDLAQRLATVREEERRAVAMVLHDGIAQDLFALKLGLDHLASLAAERSAIRDLSAELSLGVRKCMEDTRQLANELRPVALAYAGLATVLRDHARNFGSRANLHIKIRESPGFPRLGEAQQLLFFRAAQEALTNVARHAQASAVEITLTAEQGRLVMNIDDDGVGIAEADLRKTHSLGLLGLRERFESLGGGLGAHRREPNGTSVTLYLPEAS